MTLGADACEYLDKQLEEQRLSGWHSPGFRHVSGMNDGLRRKL
jgi:hypothetical protein